MDLKFLQGNDKRNQPKVQIKAPLDGQLLPFQASDMLVSDSAGNVDTNGTPYRDKGLSDHPATE